MKNYWTTIMKKVNTFITDESNQELPDETEKVKMEMHLVLSKMERSWNNFLYAVDDFNDTAVMELYRDEMEYGILYNKLLKLNGQKKENRNISFNSRDHLSWLKTDSLAQKNRTRRSTD